MKGLHAAVQILIKYILILLVGNKGIMTAGISRCVAQEVNCTAVDELHRFELNELGFICLYL